MVASMADRQKSSSKAAGTIKKVTSSSNVRSLADSDNGDISPADKKRNKLGYHRTAVACGHCRRRKIRCIPSPDTSSTRCQNCIRLKKDCQFFPVDQTTATKPPRIRTESKGEALAAESETSVSSSSPRMHAGPGTVDQFDHFPTAIETTPISRASDHDYPRSYDHPGWGYPPDPPPHQYWLQHDHNHPNSFAPSPYPITPTTAGQPITSQEHAYTYPAISLDHQNYSYGPQRPRDMPLAAHTNSVPFGGFRANTMPDRIPITEEGQRGHEMHQTAMGMPTQHIMGPPFGVMHGSPSQYAAPPTTQQMWMPASSDPQHHSAGFIQSAPPPTWYNHQDGISEIRESNSSHHNVRHNGTQDLNQFRSKPG